MNRKRMWTVISMIALLVCLASVGYAVHYKFSEKQGKAAYGELQETAKSGREVAAGETPAAEDSQGQEGSGETWADEERNGKEVPEDKAAPVNKKKGLSSTPTPVPLEIPVDFHTLQKENKEIYAWITIPGTAIDYPVLQSSTDDSFYIHRGVDGSYLYAGAIYSEMQNNIDFSDFNTVLYGHNMKDGSMFASLHMFKDRDFFDKEKEILVYTPEHILHYTIFAAYTFDDRHILNTFDFQNEKSCQEYLDEVFGVRTMDAFFKEEVEVTAEDKILTLSTCIGNAPSSRYLVQGVLTEVE